MITKQQIKALLNNWTTFGKWNDEMKKELASQILSFISKEREETLRSVLPKELPGKGTGIITKTERVVWNNCRQEIINKALKLGIKLK